jgi:pyruvate/2-oxoacid:ferredoxin oxidoreductase beta subunit
MFGERMVVANATGCSSIWGGSAPSNPYTVNPLTGRGPAWANSLFEDNAQFGLGISMGLKQRRASYAAAVKSLLADKEGPGSAELRNAFGEWLQVRLWVRVRDTVLSFLMLCMHLNTEPYPELQWHSTVKVIGFIWGFVVLALRRSWTTACCATRLWRCSTPS